MSSENTISLAEGDVKEVAVPQQENKDHYRVNIRQGQVRFGDTKADTFRGSIGMPGDRGKITPEPGDTVWIRNVGLTGAKIELVPRGLEIDWYPNQQIEVTDKVFPALQTDVITSSSAGETLNFKDKAVPQGAKMTIRPAPGNSGDILINGEFLVDTSYSTPISNMANVDIQFTDSGDEAQAVVEADN